jgi:hypothetical protein
LFPAVHRRWKASSVPKVLTGMRLVPTMAPDSSGVSLVGRF